MSRDAPYPELKTSHTMAHVGRPWTDYKPPPAAPVWNVIQGLGSYYVLLAALELDVFDTMGELGPCSVDGLATRLSVSEPHLGSLLDSLVALELLDQYCDLYSLNDAARRYLVSDGAASMADLIAVAPGPHENWTRLADTVRSGRPSLPIDEDPSAFYVPLVEGTFTTMRRCAARADRLVRYRDLAAPRVLDLGAGGAPWSISILEACPDGQAVINDLPGVIDVARRTTAEAGVDDRCEFRVGDFHDIEFEDDVYDLVILGHVCRTEGPEGARHLIDRAFAALRPEGRLLLTDYFVDPERKFNPHAVLMGMTMMTSTVNGFPISNIDATTWMREVGFEALRLIEPIGFQFTYVATKPRARP